jgi:hypothetical protein
VIVDQYQFKTVEIRIFFHQIRHTLCDLDLSKKKRSSMNITGMCMYNHDQFLTGHNGIIYMLPQKFITKKKERKKNSAQDFIIT